MKHPFATILTLAFLCAATPHPAGADPTLAIGKTLATPRIVTIVAQASSTASGQLLRDTLAGIADASVSKPYVIRLEPGIYSLGSVGLSMKQWVTIAGSGQNNTKISGSAGVGLSGVIIAASHSELRDLTVQNSNNAVTIAIGVYANSVADFHLYRVNAFATKASLYNYAAYVYDASLEITDAFLQATTQTESGFSYGLFISGSSMAIRDTAIKAFASGAGKARGIYNWDSSPTLNHVVIESSWHSGQTGEACGILNYSDSSPQLNNVSITAMADADSADSVTRAIGIDSYSGSSFTVSGGKVVADARGTTAVGIRARNGSDLSLQSATVTAKSFGGTAIALFTVQTSAEDPSATVRVNNSALVAEISGGGGGGHYALWNDSPYAAKLGATLLDGNVLGTGTAYCQACYDGDYEALDDNCQ